jgi:REP-associated tyrosine transposase
MESFGNISNGVMHLSKMGLIADEFWNAITIHFKNIKLDEYIIMPDHIHGIIIVNDGDMGNNGVENADLRSLHFYDHPSPTASVDNYDRTKMVVSKIVHGFKSSVTREIRRQIINSNFGWQKSFYDHIIRNKYELSRIRDYIIENPSKLK